MPRDPSRPKLIDWLALVVTLGGALGSIALLPSDRDKAISNIAFFGFCAAVCAFSIARKLRSRHLHVTKVQITGGVRIRPSRTMTFGLSGALLGLGLIMLVFGRGFGPVYSVLGGFIALVGAALFAGVVAGKLPPGYMRFDPGGITIGQLGSAFTVGWTNIASVAVGTVNDNPALMLTLHDVDAVIAEPPQAKPRVLAKLESNIRWHGAPVVLLTMFYAIDVEVLRLAIERYARERDARAELARSPRIEADTTGGARPV